MFVLGIESSAHTLGIGIIEFDAYKKKLKILADSRFQHISKGIIPREIARMHMQNFTQVLESALDGAGLSPSEIDGVGYTRGPGIGRCLNVGEIAARTIAFEMKKPIVGVNHALAHVEITRFFAKADDPLVLYVSGGNSQIIVKEGRHYHIIGETLDIGLGNLLDSFARELNLEKAWGSELQKLAENGKYIQMPYSIKGMDFTFTGLLTYATKLIGREDKKDLAYSLMHTSFAIVAEATERALALTNKKDLLACGGVAQNKELQKILNAVAKEHSAKFYTTEKYNSDNGVMIAYTAAQMLANHVKSPLGIKQRYRIDEAEVVW